MLQRAARNAYSWWWASHVRTKQSKWLDQNLQDMEEKVEYILKIIDEDGDTFRQRAEMYYRKRPEIVNFVEDAFRGYRALAERYDHLSKELQSANRAIAAIYPERISFGMDENDDFELGKVPAMGGLPLDELNTLSKNPPAPPKLNIPKTHNVLRKNPNAPTRLMSKKGLLKINPDDADSASAADHHHVPVPVPCSGLSKSEALERIDKLQKEILTLQTEKEFLRSAYESRAEKYWQIEKLITEMQGEVNDLQDEFGIGMVIGDDEARTLMTTSAMRSCQETLAHLQDKQKQAAEDASIEFQKVQEAREKFEKLKEKLNYNQGEQHLHLVKNKVLSPNSEQTKLEEQKNGSTEDTIHDLETLHRKIKEESQAGPGNSLTISDLAEQVDELVEKVISLGNVVSSQNAYVNRLRSETNELQGHIRSLEGEKEMLIDDSCSKSHKIKELEQELQRVQSLNQCINEQNNNLQTQLVEASCNFDDLSEKLLHAEPDEEEENVILSSQTIPVKKVQLQEVKVTRKSEPEDFKDLNTKEAEEKAQEPEKNTCNIGEQKNLAKTISSYPQNQKLLASSATNRELRAQGMMNGMITPDQALEADLWKRSMSDMDNDKNPFLSSQRDNISNFSASPARTTPESSSSGWEEGEVNPSNNGKDLIYQEGKHPIEAGPSDASARGFKEQQNETFSFDFTERGMTAEAIKDDFFWFNSNKVHQNDIYSSVGGLLDGNPEISDRRDSIIPTKSMEMKNEENKGEISGVYASTSAEERRHSDSVQPVHDGCERKSDQCGSSAEDVEMTDELKKSGNHATNKLRDENYSKWKKDLFGERGIDKKTGMKEQNVNLNRGNSNGSSGKSSTQPNHDLQVTTQMRSTSKSNQQKEGFNKNVNVANPETEMNLKQNSLTDQGNDDEVKRQNMFPSKPSTDNEDEDVGEEEDDQPNWRDLFLSGIDDKEKILLNEYTSVLRNYKEARKKLNEVEKKKRASLFQYCIQIKVLKSANAEKESEIQSLREQLNFVQADQTQDEAEVESKEGKTMATSLHISDDQPSNGDKKEKGLQDLSGKETSESKHDTTEETVIEQPSVSFVEKDQDVKIVEMGDSHKFSIIEEKIRTDIDELLEENIGFWMRFSTTFHQIQKFQTTVQDLQEEIAKLKGKSQKGGSTDHHHQSLSSDIRPIYQHLTEIQTELALWLDHNAVIKDDLENRSSSLSSIQEEILRLSSIGSKEEQVTGLDDYQAAKFQGELLNMKQENNKVADELKTGLERVKNLQVEIEKTLKQIDDEFDVSVKRHHHSRYAAVRSRIPLKSFLFGVKLKKQKRPSFFACISPSLQKQQSDITVSPM